MCNFLTGFVTMTDKEFSALISKVNNSWICEDKEKSIECMLAYRKCASSKKAAEEVGITVNRLERILRKVYSILLYHVEGEITPDTPLKGWCSNSRLINNCKRARVTSLNELIKYVDEAGFSIRNMGVSSFDKLKEMYAKAAIGSGRSTENVIKDMQRVEEVYNKAKKEKD